MRRLQVGVMVFAMTVLVPIWALAGNQEVAEQIAANLRESGQLRDYKIGVKYLDGTAWLRGRVSSAEQMQATLKLASQTPGVTRVVNNLSIGSRDDAASPASSNAQPLKQVAGAVAPDRLFKVGPSSLRVPPRHVEADAAPETLQEVPSAGEADRVATSFDGVPVQQVSATTPQPALAPPILAQSTGEPDRAPMTLATPRAGRPIPIAYTQASGPMPLAEAGGKPVPQYAAPVGAGVAPARYDQPYLPNYAWPSYAAYPNYAALTYPKQYSPTAWPYIGPFYPYPQVPLGWRKVTLEWHDGWWQLDFDDGPRRGGFLSGLFRPSR